MHATLAGVSFRVPLADHPLLETIPFFVPALVIVAILVGIAVRDRRRSDDET